MCDELLSRKLSNIVMCDESYEFCTIMSITEVIVDDYRSLSQLVKSQSRLN